MLTHFERNQRVSGQRRSWWVMLVWGSTAASERFSTGTRIAHPRGADSRSGVVGRVAQDHQLSCLDREHRVGAAIGSRELHLEHAALVGHHDGADLPAMQQQWLAAFEMSCAHIVEERDHVVHPNITVHGSFDITSRQPWEALPMADNPNTQHGCRALLRAKWDAKHIYIAKAVVPAPLGLIGARRMITQRLAKEIRIRERDTQQGVEYARLVLSFAVQRVEHIFLDLHSEVSLLAVGQFRCTDLLREPVKSANAFIGTTPRCSGGPAGLHQVLRQTAFWRKPASRKYLKNKAGAEIRTPDLLITNFRRRIFLYQDDFC
jgi:hypothetical protein